MTENRYAALAHAAPSACPRYPDLSRSFFACLYQSNLPKHVIKLQIAMICTGYVWRSIWPHIYS